MILTLRSYVKERQKKSSTGLGSEQTLPPPAPSWGAILVTQIAAGGLWLSGLALTFGLGGAGSFGTWGGVTVQLIGVYALIAAAKEGASLRVFEQCISTMSEDEKAKFIQAWVKKNLNASGGLMTFIEWLLNLVSKGSKS